MTIPNPKTFLKALALGLVTAIGAGGTAHAAEGGPEAYPLLLCPHGCGIVEGDTILMNQMIRAGAPAVLQPQVTPGYMANIRMMTEEKRWDTTVFGTEGFVLDLYAQGNRPELEQFIPEPVRIPFKFLYGGAWWAQGRFLVTYNEELDSVEDLKGKTISLGLRTQSDFGVSARLFLEYGFGITPENTEINHVTPSAAIQQLIDGTTVASVAAFATEPHLKEFLVPGPLRQAAAAGDLNYIGIPAEVTEKINERFNTDYISVTIPAGTLPDQEEDFQVALSRGYKTVHPSFPDEAAYNIVKWVLEIGPKMKKQELHPLWQLWSPDLMLHGLSPQNTHPGAIRAYKEAGLWDIATEKFAEYQVSTYQASQ